MWTEISQDLVLQRMTVTERDTVKNVDDPTTAEGTPIDVLQQTIDSTIAEIRNAIATCERNTLDTTSLKTIPQSLVPTALALITYRFASRALQQPILVQDARYQEYSKALATLDKLRTCEILAENPITGTVSRGESAVEVVSARETRFSRRNFRMM